MKYSLLAVALVIAMTSQAKAPEWGKKVFVRFDTRPTVTGHWVTGDTMPAPAIVEIFYVQQLCHLQLAAADNMRYYYNLLSHHEGCWFPTMDGGYTTVNNDGFTDHASQPMEEYPMGLLYPDNSFKIQSADFDSQTWQMDVMKKLIARLNERAKRVSQGDPQQ